MTWLEFIYEVGGAIGLWLGFSVLDTLVMVIRPVVNYVKEKVAPIRDCSWTCSRSTTWPMTWAVCIAAAINLWNLHKIFDYYLDYSVGAIYEP